MRSSGDISLPLHVTNETAHHKVRGLSWVTVSWFFLRDISVEFFPEVFLVALSTTSSVPSSSSVFQKRADISTIDILKTSPKQPRWMAEEFDEEFRWRFICFHGSHFVPHFNPCQCLHLAHTFLKTSNRRMRFTVISSNFQDFGWPRLSVQRLERHRFSILARASNHHSGSIHQWLALTIFLPPPPVSYLCLELRLALSLQLIFQLHSVLKLQLLAHIHFLWRKKIKLPHRLMLNFSFQLFFSTFMSSDFSFTQCSHENTTG